MKKNTKIWKTLFKFSVVLSIFINFIGIIADLFGFADGIGKHKNLFLDVVSFLASKWKWITGASAVICLIIIIVLNIWKKHEEKRLANKLSWFDAEMRSTDFVGGLDQKFQLKQFLKQKDIPFSWWAVTGVVGMGKTRLVIETLNDDEFRNADVQWLRYFSDYRIDALKKRIDNILGSPFFNNIIISEDAQMYMDNIGVLIEYVSQKTDSEFGDHRLRLLLLIRTYGDENLQDRYKQLTSETNQFTLKQTRFSLYGQELRLSKYSETDIASIVKSYILNTIKKRRGKKLDEEKLSALQKKTVNTLKLDNMDSEHLRPLFAMFIADALLIGAEPMSWNIIDVFEYTALKHEKLLGEEIREIKGKYSHHVCEKTKYIICMSIIRNGIELSELGEIGTELEDELKFAQIGLKDYFIELQLLGSDGIIRVHMPNILAEYFVLHTLVINPNTVIVDWVTNRLCDSLKGVPEFSQKLRQDFRYMYENIEDKLDDFYNVFFEKCDASLATEIIKKQIAKRDFNDFNSIMLHEAIGNLIRNEVDLEWLSEKFYFIISLESNEVNKWWCLYEIERLAVNDQIIHHYCNSLIAMMNACDYDYREHSEEIAFCLSELKRFANRAEENGDNAYLYCCGLVNTLDKLPETKIRDEHLFELKRISDIYSQNIDIVECYSKGLSKIMKDTIETSMNQLYLSELKSLTDSNPKKSKIAYWYSAGLLTMIGAGDEEERFKYLKELQRLFDAYPNDASIVSSFCDGLIYMITFTTELEKKKEILSQIECLVHDAGYDDSTIAETKYRFNLQYTINGQIFFSYCKGLLVLLQATPDMAEKKEYLSKIKSLADNNPWFPDFLTLYSNGLFFIFDATSNMEEKKKFLIDLKHLLKKSSSLGVFFPSLFYCKVIYIMSHLDVKKYNYYMSEICRILSNENVLKFIAANDQDFLYSIRRPLLDYQKNHPSTVRYSKRNYELRLL